MQSMNISRQIDINVLLKVPRALSLILLQRLPAEVHPRRILKNAYTFKTVNTFLVGGIEMQSSSIYYYMSALLEQWGYIFRPFYTIS